MKKILIVIMALIIALTAKYHFVTVYSTNTGINNKLHLYRDKYNNNYLLDNALTNNKYILLIDRNNIFNTEDNAIILAI